MCSQPLQAVKSPCTPSLCWVADFNYSLVQGQLTYVAQLHILKPARSHMTVLLRRKDKSAMMPQSSAAVQNVDSSSAAPMSVRDWLFINADA